MRLFDTIETIRDIFRKKVAYDISGSTLNTDASILAEMASEVSYVLASNDKKYFYYVPHFEADVDFARFLFERNGLKLKRHISYYTYMPSIVLRIRVGDLTTKSKQFADLVISHRSDMRVVDNQTRIRAAMDFARHCK